MFSSPNKIFPVRRWLEAWAPFLDSAPGNYLFCFSKVPRTFLAQKASYQIAIRLFSKANLLPCFQSKKNQEDWEVWRLRTSALRRYKGNWGTRSRPEESRDFWQTGPQICYLLAVLYTFRIEKKCENCVKITCSKMKWTVFLALTCNFS